MTKSRIVFVHGVDGYGAAAWPAQHLLAGDYDCLFLKRTGFAAEAAPVAADFVADTAIVVDSLGEGGHVVAHGQGAVPAMLAAVERPDLVRSLILIEPLLLSLTSELPATAAFIERLAGLLARAGELSDMAFLAEFSTLMAVASPLNYESADRRAARARLLAASTGAPLHIIPGVPTQVLTGGWEPLYEEVADYLAATGAKHVIHRSGHRPHDTPKGAKLVQQFIAENITTAGA